MGNRKLFGAFWKPEEEGPPGQASGDAPAGKQKIRR